MPGSTLPGGTLPGGTLPGDKCPGGTLPGTLPGGGTLPGTLPGGTLPGSSLSGTGHFTATSNVAKISYFADWDVTTSGTYQGQLHVVVLLTTGECRIVRSDVESFTIIPDSTQDSNGDAPPITPTFTPTITPTPLPTETPTPISSPSPASSLDEIVKRVETLTPAEAADVIEDTLQNLGSEDAAYVIVEIREAIGLGEVAAIIEKVSDDSASQIISHLQPAAASDLLAEVSPNKAAAVLEGMSTNVLVSIVREMNEEKLTERLQVISVEKLLDIPTDTLLERLPKVSAGHLIFEVAPQGDPGLAPPSANQISPKIATHSISRTGNGTWTTLISGSSGAINRALGKFTNELTDVRLIVEMLDEQPVGTPELNPDKVIKVIKEYFEVALENGNPEDLSVVHLTLDVEKSWIEDAGIHRWSIQLERYDEVLDAWVPFPTRRVDESESHVTYTSVIPGFSLFAITGSELLPEPSLDVSNLTTVPDRPYIGQDVTVGVQVTNTSPETVIYPANLWIDGVIEDTESIALSPGETRFVDFTFKPDAVGRMNIRIERLFGSLEVAQIPEPTATVVPPTPTFTAISPSATPTTMPTATQSPIASPTIPPPTPTATATPVPQSTSTPTPTAQSVESEPTPEIQQTEEASGEGMSVPAFIGIAVGFLVLAGAAAGAFAYSRKRK